MEIRYGVREKEHKRDVKTLEEKKYNVHKIKEERLTNGIAPFSHYRPCSKGQPHHTP